MINEISQTLNNRNADFEIIKHDKPILSKMDASGIFNIEETAPTLILETDKGYMALIISGERDKIQFKQLKKLMNCSKLQLADQGKLQEELNLTAGQVPLIGHNLPCIINKKIFNYPYVYGGTGDSFYTLKIKPDDLVKSNNVICEFE
jgi:Cys-tRNA(Pro)/Cys-tRNA(Cys) deacylase